MKKLFAALLVLLLALLCSGALADIIIEGTFTDPVFIQYITDVYDGDKDGILTRSEYLAIESTVTLNLKNAGLKDATGLQMFKNLKTLDLSKNDLTELDVTWNKELVEIHVENNSKLTKLTLGTKSSLEELYCYQCKLTSLDISGAANLKRVECQYNRLTSLKLGSQPALETLYCVSNNIKSLDISKCPKLNAYVVNGKPVMDTAEVLHWGTTAAGFAVDQKVTIITTKGLFNVKAEKITVDQKKVTLTRTAKKPEPTVTLKATVAPEDTRNKAVKWTSSDPAIAKVDAKTGKVTALKAGKVTITCTAVDGSGVKASCKITVEDTLVQEIILNKSEATLIRTAKNLNPTLKLKAKKVTPKEAVNTEVTWKSSNTKVATVDPKTGKVTALKAGTCKITCTAADGSKVKAVCKITVKDTLVTAITLNRKTAQLKVGKTLQLKIKKITPKDAVNQNVKWKSSNRKVATVDKNGKVTAVKAGTCKITCTAADGSKVYVVCEITVK